MTGISMFTQIRPYRPAAPPVHAVRQARLKDHHKAKQANAVTH
jgi:hypothetical protein